MPHTFPLPTQSEPCSARPSSPAEPVLPRNQGRVQTCKRLGSLTAVVKHDRESGGLEQCRFLLTQFWRLKGHDPFQWGQSQGVDRAASLKGLEASPSPCLPRLPDAAHLPASFQPFVSIITSPVSPLILLCPLLQIQIPFCWNHLDSPGCSSHLKTLTSITSAKLLFPCKAASLGSED